MDFGYKTDCGLKRELNEDSFLFNDYNERYILSAVADGMGGHNAGDIASSLAIEEVKSYDNEIGFNENIQINLIECVKQVNSIIYNKAISDSSLTGMGTTLTISVITKEEIHIAHIGDSRAYLVDVNKNEIRKITIDHSYVEELLRMGKISKEEAKNHPNKNHITKAIGTDEIINPDIYLEKYKKDDILLLCSDGLTNMIEEECILDIIKNSQSMQNAVDSLIETANENGGYDNITVIGLKL